MTYTDERNIEEITRHDAQAEQDTRFIAFLTDRLDAAIRAAVKAAQGDRDMRPMRDEIAQIISEVAVSFEQGQGRISEIDAATDEIMALIEERFTTTEDDTSLSEVPMFTQD